MSNNFRVSAAALNFRSTPEVALDNRIAVLPQGKIVERLSGDATDHWWQVSTTISGQLLQGFVAKDHLSPVSVPEPTVSRTGTIPKVHLVKNSPVLRSQTSGRAFPLNETGQPSRSSTDLSGSLTNIVRWLDVEQSNRYTRVGNTTFCNIYAYDYCFLAGVFLPRVWWTRKAISDLNAGKDVPIRLGDTVRELNANSIFDWFEDFSDDFGWERVFDLTDLQDAANQGKVCIISGQRKELDRPGHICAVVPEIPGHSASRSGGRVTVPLQSQAGASNFSYGGSNWWTDIKFRSFGFWVHS